MDVRSRRVLILDTDPDTLITLQHVLENAGLDTTITWGKAEACQAVETSPFDLILIRDHPPELNAAAILDDLSYRGICAAVLILRTSFSCKDAEYFRRLGATGVVSKRDPLAVLEHVTKTLAAMQFKARSARAGLVEARSYRAAS